MKRREFITLLGGAAASWPFAARAQQAERIRRVGHEKYLPEFDGLREQLRELGYIEGKNLAINWRYADQGPVELLVLARKDRKSTRLNSSHIEPSRMPSSA